MAWSSTAAGIRFIAVTSMLTLLSGLLITKAKVLFLRLT